MLTQQEFANRYLGANGNRHNACKDAVNWLKSISKNNRCDLREAWKVCERSSWMMWMYYKVNPDKEISTIFAKWCAEYDNAVTATYAYTPQVALIAALKKHKRISADKCREIVPCPWE